MVYREYFVGKEAFILKAENGIGQLRSVDDQAPFDFPQQTPGIETFMQRKAKGTIKVAVNDKLIELFRMDLRQIVVVSHSANCLYSTTTTLAVDNELS
jgi:hypothetical protein